MDEPMGRVGPFAQRLRALREAAALTQEELAQRAGLTSNAIGALERGERRRPYPHTVRSLAAALDLDEAGLAALAAAARPSPRSHDAHAAIAEPDRAADDPGPATAAGLGRAALAAPSTPLFGRDAELADIVARLRAGDVRLLTLTGPGGVGKTRLALAAAARLEPDFPDGVALAELAPVADPELVLPTVAGALGLPQVGRQDVIGQLAGYLGRRRPLLVLDNVEHVLAVTGDLAELVSRCPSLTIVATSRAPLRIRAEREQPVSPLALPSEPSSTAVVSSPAGQMFLDRARAVAPGYSVTRESAPVITEICRRLEGVPLALELAAAHARLLAPTTLLDRLDQAVAAGRSRELPPRQRTMQATLDWSHALLTREEQALLRRLSVFAGGFTLPVAEAVIERVPGDDLDVFGALAGLVDQSLVVAADAGGRYRLLEPIRQYAGARLAEANETTVVEAAHAEQISDLGTRALAGLRGRDQRRWLDRLDREHGNLRAALAWLIDRSENGRAAQLLADTWLYWALRGHAGEGLAALDRILGSDPGRLPDDHRAPALVALAGLRYATGDVAGTCEAGAEAVESARPGARVELLGEALLLAASGAAFAGDMATATDRLGLAASLGTDLGPWLEIHLRLLHGQMEVLTGNLVAARETLAGVERLARRLDSPFSLATVLNIQASLAKLAGEDDDALERLIEAATLADGVGSSWTQVYTVPALADLAGRAGQLELAVRLYAAAATLAEATGLAVSFPPDVERGVAGVAQVRAQIDPSTFAGLWEAGRGLPLAELAELAGSLRGEFGPAEPLA
ncbi:MAG TPA: helix-turn-helix domain-containing protein [Microlunatus sp.]